MTLLIYAAFCIYAFFILGALCVIIASVNDCFAQLKTLTDEIINSRDEITAFRNYILEIETRHNKANR